MKIPAAILAIATVGLLAGCGHDEMVRKDTTTTTTVQPPPIVQQHTTTEIGPKDD